MNATNPNGLTGAMAPVPSSPIAPNAGAKKDTGSIAAAVNESTDAPAAFPELANLPIPAAPAPVGATANTTGTTDMAATTNNKIGATKTDTAADTKTDTAAAATATGAPPLPPMVTEGTDAVAGEEITTNTPPAASPLTVAAPPTTLPGFSLPTPPSGIGNVAPATSGMQTATALPEVDVVAPPKKRMGGRTWTTKLAPAIVPKNTNFNYRRQVLPDAIYRTAYDRENQHLPTRVTREDYQQLLVQRVAANDINGTRALLNEGLSVNSVDGYGQSLLSVARQYGARDTERLLIARGAS